MRPYPFSLMQLKSLSMSVVKSLCLAKGTKNLKKKKKKGKRKKQLPGKYGPCSQVAHKHGEPWIQMPVIRQTRRNIVNRGSHNMPSEYLRMERVTLLWSKDLQQAVLGGGPVG